MQSTIIKIRTSIVYLDHNLIIGSLHCVYNNNIISDGHFMVSNWNLIIIIINRTITLGYPDREQQKQKRGYKQSEEQYHIQYIPLKKKKKKKSHYSVWWCSGACSSPRRYIQSESRITRSPKGLVALSIHHILWWQQQQ